MKSVLIITVMIFGAISLEGCMPAPEKKKVRENKVATGIVVDTGSTYDLEDVIETEPVLEPIEPEEQEELSEEDDISSIVTGSNDTETLEPIRDELQDVQTDEQGEAVEIVIAPSDDSSATGEEVLEGDSMEGFISLDTEVSETPEAPAYRPIEVSDFTEGYARFCGNTFVNPVSDEVFIQARGKVFKLVGHPRAQKKFTAMREGLKRDYQKIQYTEEETSVESCVAVAFAYLTEESIQELTGIVSPDDLERFDYSNVYLSEVTHYGVITFKKKGDLESHPDKFIRALRERNKFEMCGTFLSQRLPEATGSTDHLLLRTSAGLKPVAILESMGNQKMRASSILSGEGLSGNGCVWFDKLPTYSRGLRRLVLEVNEVEIIEHVTRNPSVQNNQ